MCLFSRSNQACMKIMGFIGNLYKIEIRCKTNNKEKIIRKWKMRISQMNLRLWTNENYKRIVLVHQQNLS